MTTLPFCAAAQPGVELAALAAERARAFVVGADPEVWSSPAQHSYEEARASDLAELDALIALLDAARDASIRHELAVADLAAGLAGTGAPGPFGWPTLVGRPPGELVSGGWGAA